MSASSSPAQAAVAPEEEFLWDRVARTAMGRYVTEVETAFIARGLATLDAPRKLALDAGAGSGRMTSLLAGSFGRVVATETRPDLVRRLGGVGLNVEAVFVEPAEERLPLADATADAIVSIQAADLTQAAWFHRECARALRPGGLLMVNTQNRRSWKGLIARGRQDRYVAEFGATYYAWSLGEFAERLGEAGLEVERASGYNWLPFGRMSDNGLVAPLATLESLLGLRRLPSLSPWVLVAARKPSFE